jgi:hypothetical protein
MCYNKCKCFILSLLPFNICMYFICLAPELVIYDNSCRLHEYCLNRDPTFFKNTKFVVDKFHWKNHSGTYMLDIVFSFIYSI